MYKKKLIEVAIPLDAINIACKADKDRKTGTVRNIHKWFAPMPLPAWRGLLLAALLDDPGDDESRLRLLELIEKYVQSGADPPSEAVIDEVSAELQAHLGDGAPLVIDPFCGGGSTVIEAQRLGVPARGSDLNPVPVLITSFLSSTPKAAALLGSSSLIDGPASADDLRAELRRCAGIVRDRARSRLEEFYPPAPNGETVIAWRWARTVPSPDPRFQGHGTPLVGDWRMSTNPGSESYVRPLVSENSINYEIVDGLDGVPEPSKGRCLLSGAPIDFAYIRENASAALLGVEMFGVATESRHFFAPDEIQVDCARAAVPEWIPDFPLPRAGLGFRVQNYGLKTWDQIFTPRQILALDTFANEVGRVHSDLIESGSPPALAKWIASFLALCVGKLATFNSSQCLWRLRKGPSKVEAAFGQAILPMTFDFAETNPFGGSVGDWTQCVETALRALDSVDKLRGSAEVLQLDARHSFERLPDGPILVATDPPYFAQIGYADLSDFFYMWHRRALAEVDNDLYSTVLTPKSQELIADPSRHSGDVTEAAEYFVDGLTSVLAGARSANPEYPALVVYASRQEEAGGGIKTTAWEAMLASVIAAGWQIDGTWPIWGTGSTRRRAQSSNALATYIVLVCRPRAVSAPTETRKGFVTALRPVLKGALRSLQSASIAPVDLTQAAMGPGMSVFSSFGRVLEADGSPMSVGAALGVVNDLLDETLAGSEVDFDSDTRWALTWFEEVGFKAGPFGKAEQLSKARNTSIDGLVRAGVIESGQGRVRLLERAELPDQWNPTTDSRLTIWEVTQHLIRRLEEGGEHAAAALMRLVGASLADSARELAYRLFMVAESRGWATDASAYNTLVVAWPELTRLAASSESSSRDVPSQGELL